MSFLMDRNKAGVPGEKRKKTFTGVPGVHRRAACRDIDEKI